MTVGPHPNAVAVNSATNRIYVPTDNVIAVMDGNNDTVVATIPLASPDHFPYRVAVNATTNLIYAMTGSMLVVFDDPLPQPADSIAALIRWVTSLNLAQGTSNSLDAKLTNAQNALESVKGGDAGTACNKLDSFINEAQAQESKQQSTAIQVRELVVEARLLKSSLGCQ